MKNLCTGGGACGAACGGGVDEEGDGWLGPNPGGRGCDCLGRSAHGLDTPGTGRNPGSFETDGRFMMEPELLSKGGSYLCLIQRARQLEPSRRECERGLSGAFRRDSPAYSRA